MSVNVKAKQPRRIIRMKNIPTVLRIRSNGYSRNNDNNNINTNHSTSLPTTRKALRSKWLAIDPVEFINKIRQIKQDIQADISLRESVILTSTYLQTDPNIFKSQDIFNNNCYGILLTESEPCNTQRFDEERIKTEQNDDYPIITLPESIDSPDPVQRNAFTFNSPIEISNPLCNSELSNRDQRPINYTDNFCAMKENTTEPNYPFDNYEAYPPIPVLMYSNNKFDHAVQPMSMSMTMNPYYSPGRGSYHPMKSHTDRTSRRVKKIVNHYFLINEDEENLSEEKYTYTVDYMKEIQNMEITKQSLLLPSEVQDHLNQYAIVDTVYLNSEGNPIGDNDDDAQSDDNSHKGVYNEEIAHIAMENKDEIINKITIDETKADIRELLNTITIDNYETIKSDLSAIVKQSGNHQYKFNEILLHKAIYEKCYAGIYAKVYSDLDKTITNKKTKNKSIMRTNLIDICKKAFKNEQYYSLANDEGSIKKYVIGLANFIGELINVHVISKRVGIQCLNTLYDKYKTNHTSYSIEAFIVLLGKYGEIIERQQDKIRKDELLTYQDEIEGMFSKLNSLLNEESKTLSSYVWYKIKNLQDKKKNGWKPTLYEMSQCLQMKELNGDSTNSNNENSCNSSRIITTDDNNDSRGNSLNNSTIKSSNPQSHRVNNHSSSFSNDSPFAKNKSVIQHHDLEIQVDSGRNSNFNSSTITPVVNTTIKTDLDKIYDIILKDLDYWSKFLQNGNYANNYQWKDVDYLLSNGTAKIDDIILCYIDAAEEYLLIPKNKKGKKNINDYFKVFIEYYSKNMTQKTVDKTVEIITEKAFQYCINKNRQSLSCRRDIIVNVLYYLFMTEVIQMKDFNSFLQEDYSTIEAIIDLLFSVIFNEGINKNKLMKKFEETRLYKENPKIINDLLNN